jgi:hypothetical protein
MIFRAVGRFRNDGNMGYLPVASGSYSDKNCKVIRDGACFRVRALTVHEE